MLNLTFSITITASKRRGSRPCHYSPGIGGVTRAVLRSLEGMKIIQKVADAK